MRRIIIMVLKKLFVVPFWFMKISKLGTSDKYDEETRYSYLRKCVIKANKAGRITVVPHGLDNIPKETGYIMFPNHQGLFDALGFLECLERPFSVVMKKETQNNYFLKRIKNILRAQIIDREDVRQSMRVIMNMTKEVKEGRNYVIFAEGTRSRKGNEVLDFKGGTFKSAMNARCPIIPVALIDSFAVFDTKSIKKATVHLFFLPPLYYDDYKDLKSVDIAELVKNRIQETINENLPIVHNTESK